MANAVRGQVAATVGDRDLVLEYTIDAFCHLEDRLGEDASTILGRLGTDNRVSFLRSVLWAGLLENQRQANGSPEFDEKAAGELLRQRGGAALKLKVKQALDAAFPDAEAAADGPKDPPPTPAGTGLDS